MKLEQQIDKALGTKKTGRIDRALEALRKGTRAEMEHAKTVKWLKKHPKAPLKHVAGRIAKDHLREDPHYYDRLEVLEKKRGPGKPPKSPRIKLLTRRGKLRVYLVDGTKVRKLTHLNPDSPDFTMGTGDQVWENVTGPWEVWISDELGPLEQKLTMLHEMTERRLMKRQGMSYDDAHDVALGREDKYRKAGGKGLVQALAKERGQ